MTLLKTLLEKYDKDNLYRDSMIVIVLTNMGSVTNLLFHVVMGNLLTEGTYAVLASMLGVYLIFTTPILAIQNTLAHFAAYLDQHGRRGDIRRLSRQWLVKISLVLLPLSLLATLLLSQWQSMLHLSSGLPVLIVIMMVVAAYYVPVFVGALQGIQSFVWMCIAANGWAVVRILLGSVLVLTLGGAAIYGLEAHLVGTLFGLVVGIMVFQRFIPRNEATDQPLDKSDKYLLLSMVSLFSFSILMTGDVVLVKIFFPSEADYGPYTRASTIARMLFFVCQPIAGALFPKVISKGEKSAQHNVTLWKALGLTALAIAGAVVVCVAIPRFPLFLLYHVRDADAQLLSLVRWVTVAIAPLGITFMLMNFEMAQHRFDFMMPLALCATAFVAGAFWWHATTFQFVGVFAVATYASLVVMLYYLFKPGREDSEH